MTPVADITPEPIEHQPDRAAAERHLLRCGRIPTGSRERLALDFGVSLSTASLWIARSKRAGLLSVTREGRRNAYSINFEALRRLADERAGR